MMEALFTIYFCIVFLITLAPPTDGRLITSTHYETIQGIVIFTAPEDVMQDYCQYPYPGTSQCWPCLVWNLRNHSLANSGCRERLPREPINRLFTHRIFRSEIIPCTINEDGIYECNVVLTHNEKTASVDLTLISDGVIRGFVNLQNETRRGSSFEMAYLRHGDTAYDGDRKTFQVTVSCQPEDDARTCNIRELKLLVVKYRCI